MATKYAFKAADDKKAARSSASNARVSHKHSVEICRNIRGMSLDKARSFLEDVAEQKTPVVFRRFVREQAHRPGMAAGRYPVNAAREVLKLLENAEANADGKGLDKKKLVIVSAAANRGVRRYRGARGFGRRYSKSANIEITVEEKA